MGIFDFFRKKRKTEESDVQKIAFEDIEDWIFDKKNESRSLEEAYGKKIFSRISELRMELSSEIEVLKKINVDEMKERDKIKAVVKQGLEAFIQSVERLNDRLAQVKSSASIVNEVNKIFVDFKKRTQKSYERATYLIGREIAAVDSSIEQFFKDTEVIIKEEGALGESSNDIRAVEDLYGKILDLRKQIEEVNLENEQLGKQIAEKKELIEGELKQIDAIKNSEGYKEQMRNRAALDLKKETLDNYFVRLRKLSDFKALTRFYHASEKKMNLIKKFKTDFRLSFEEKNGEDLLGLFQEAKIPHDEIPELMGKINNLREEVDSVFLNEFGYENLEDNINIYNKQINEIDLDIERNLKRIQKLQMTLEGMRSELQGHLTSYNITLM